MIELEFSIWMATKERWVHLIKCISLPCVPHVGEYIKFSSEKVGNYFSWKVTQITYHETGKIEVWTELLENINNRMYSFEDESEFDEYLSAYISEGWEAPYGVRENTQYRQ